MSGPALDAVARTAQALTGRPLDPDALAQFDRYLDLLMAWNRAHRLTGLESPGDIARGLIADSLLFLDVLPRPPMRIVDLGAGAGIPGLPLRIVEPGVALTLVEARRKRVSFLKTVRRELALHDVAIFEGRAEIMMGQIVEESGPFDAVVARSVAPIEELAPVAMGYLKVGGRLVAAGPPAPRNTGEILELAGGSVEVRDFPEIGLKRTFLVVTRQN